MRRIAFLFLSLKPFVLSLSLFFSFCIWMGMYMCVSLQVYASHFLLPSFCTQRIFFLKSLQMGNCLTDDDKQKICNRKLHTPPTLQRGIYRLAQAKQNTMKSSASFPHNNLFCVVFFYVVSMLKISNYFIVTYIHGVIKIAIIKSSKLSADSIWLVVYWREDFSKHCRKYSSSR